MKGYGMKSVNNPSWLEKEKPVAGPMDAILKPILVAPCSSDTHSMHGGSGPQENLILGHEALGEIVEVGDMVKCFKPGDKVVVPCCTPNWLAPGVQEMKYTAHDEGMMRSFKFLLAKDGVFAEYFHVNQADANLVNLPEDMNPLSALMTVDMMSTGFHGVELADIQFGDKVVVMGIGPVGLMAVAGAQLRGAGQIVAIGTRPNCVKIAKEYGATEIVSYKEGNIVDQIREVTKGGADKVIIAGGGEEALMQAIMMVKPMGIVSNVNYFDATATLSIPAPVWGLGMANIDIRGGFCPGGRVRIQRLLSLIECNRVDPSKLITHTFKGFDQIEDAFKLMDEKPTDLIKPAVYI